jgi:hypothetical protein
MSMAFPFLTAYAQALLRGNKDKDQSGAPWPQYARGDENTRRGESTRRGEAAGFAAGGKLKSKPRGARPAKPGATGGR